MTPPTRIAYLAPEIYAISSTFVYEEIAALERLGLTIQPFSVQRPATMARSQDALKQRTEVLYGGKARALQWLMDGLVLLFTRPRCVGRAMAWLAQDMAAVGLTRAGAWKLGFQFLAGAHLARRLLHLRSEHVHIHFAHVPTQIGMYAAAMAALPFTVMAHANDIFERQLLLRQKAARAKRFLTISEFNARYLREEQGLDADQLAVVRCGVSPTVTGASSRPATTTQAGPFRLGSLGRLVEKKGFDTLIAAMGLLRDRGLHVQLEIAGDGPLQAELSRQTQALGLQGQIRFLGAVSHDQVQAWLCQLDCFVLACRQDAQGDMDGIPVALMEAMAVGLPVVSCRLSGVPELVVHGQTGLLAEPGNATDLAQQLQRFITEPGLCSSLAAAGARHVAHEFSQDLNIQRLLGHFAPSA